MSQCAIYGNFSGPKAQEIVVSRGKILELLRPDDAGKVQTVCTTEVFGCIRCLAPFRLTGASRFATRLSSLQRCSKRLQLTSRVLQPSETRSDKVAL